MISITENEVITAMKINIVSSVASIRIFNKNSLWLVLLFVCCAHCKSYICAISNMTMTVIR